MDFVFQYSGILAAIIALVFVVTPTFFVGLDHKKEPMSFVTRKRTAGLLFRFGLITTALLLFVNTIRIGNCYHFEWFTIGQLLYFLGTACMICVALIDIDRHEGIHTAFTKGYFLLSVIGSMILSVEIFHSLSIFLVISTIGGIGTLYLYYKYELKSQAEYWGIMCAILWVVTFYTL